MAEPTIWGLTLERFAGASIEDVLRVVNAADAWWRCSAEFPDDLGCCGEYMQALDDALAKCPGTSAWHFARTLPTEGGGRDG